MSQVTLEEAEKRMSFLQGIPAGKLSAREGDELSYAITVVELYRKLGAESSGTVSQVQEATATIARVLRLNRYRLWCSLDENSAAWDNVAHEIAKILIGEGWGPTAAHEACVRRVENGWHASTGTGEWVLHSAHLANECCGHWETEIGPREPMTEAEQEVMSR